MQPRFGKLNANYNDGTAANNRYGRHSHSNGNAQWGWSDAHDGWLAKIANYALFRNFGVHLLQQHNSGTTTHDNNNHVATTLLMLVEVVYVDTCC